MAKLTIKVTKTAFYDGGLVYPNEIIKNYKGDTVPSWATLAGGKEQKKEETPDNPKTPAQPKEPINPIKTDGDKEEGEEEKTPEEEEKEEGEEGEETPEEEKTELQLQEELNALLDESVEKNIPLDNFENKSIKEQIAELKTLLGKE